MAFLAPLFLLALAAIGIPVAVHLTHRQRKEPVAFPSLMFLRKVEFRTTKRQRLRHPLLFALRTLAIVLLIAAFARPFVSSGNAATAGVGGGRDVVVLLDRSYSMRAGDRWARARAAAARTIDALGPNDRATLVAFDARATTLAGPTADKGALRAALDAVRPGDATAKWGPAASLARSTLARAARPRRELLVASDLQRSGWTPDESMRLPAGTALEVVDVGEAASGVAVTGVEFVRATRDGRVEVTATARLANRGADTARALPVTLSLDGREVARATAAAVAPSAVASLVLGPFALPAAVVRGVVTAGDGAEGTGATRHFTLERGRPLRVLLASEAEASPARTLYLRRALGVAGEPAIALETVRDEVTMERLLAHDVVILDDAAPPRGQMSRRLRDWVAAGGGLLVTTGDRARGADWEGDLAGVRAAAIGDVVDRMGERGGRLGTLDRTHPALEPFAAPRSGNFSAPRFFRYRALAPAEGAATVARWDDGSPALVERRLGEGRVLFWGSTFDNLWNDLPLQPVFPPLVRQLVQHAAGWEGDRPWHVVGDAFDAAALARGADSSSAELVALAPSGRQVRLARATPTLALDEAGTWEVRRFGARGAPDRVLAVNVDAAELETGRIPAAEVTAALAPGGDAAGADGAAEATLTPAERESRQSLWWFLLLGAAAAFAAEAVMANRIARKGMGY